MHTLADTKKALEDEGHPTSYHRGRLVVVDEADGQRYSYVPELGAWYGMKLVGAGRLMLLVVPALARDGTPDRNPWPDLPYAFNTGEVEPGALLPEDAELLASLFGKQEIRLRAGTR